MDKKKQEIEKIQYHWKYSGRNFGWWLYDEDANKFIEEKYAAFLDAKQKMESSSQKNDEKPKNKSDDDGEDDENNEEEDDEEDEDDDDEPAAVKGYDTSRVVELPIGSTVYLIDFEGMMQMDARDRSRKRAIRRDKIEEVVEKVKGDKLPVSTPEVIKGQAGVKFDKSPRKGRK